MLGGFSNPFQLSIVLHCVPTKCSEPPRPEAAFDVVTERRRKGKVWGNEGREEATVLKIALPRAQPNRRGMGASTTPTLKHSPEYDLLLTHYKVKCCLLEILRS